MRIEQLKHIIVVSRCSTLSLAAESLHISVQTLSNSILSLEDELNIKILNRTNHGISLTKQGQLILNFAAQTIANYDEMQQKLQLSQLPAPAISSLTEEITVYSMPAFVNPTTSNIVISFLKDYPNVAVNLRQMPCMDICNRLQETEDSAIGLMIVPYKKQHYLKPFIQNHDFYFRPMAVTQFVCCVPCDSPLLEAHSVSIYTLLSYPIVCFSTGDITQSPLYHALKKYKPDIQFSIVTSSHDYWAQSIKNGMGIGFINLCLPLSGNMLSPICKDLIMLRIKEPLPTISGVLYRKNSSQTVKAFVDQLPLYTALKDEPKLGEPF